MVLTPTGGDFRDTLVRTGTHVEVTPYPIWSRGEILRWGPRLWTTRARARRQLLELARLHTPAIVHGDLAVTPYLTQIAAALDIPAVVHVRGPVRRRTVRRLELSRAAGIVSIGDRYRDDLLRCAVPGDRLAVVADATDLDRFRPRQDEVLRRRDPFIPPDAVLFGIVGRIEPFKQQLDFLRAARRVIAAGRRAHFVVIGAPNPNRPWYVRRVQTFAADALGRRVTLTGHRGDIERVLSSLDVLVTLSGGSVMLEAMASGVPVVTASARDPGSLRMVRDQEGGRVVTAGDPEALVRVMVELCDDAGQRRRLGATGRRRAELLFGRQRLVDETVRVYESIY